MMEAIRFNAHQRAQLLTLGLIEESIHQIEVDALPRVKATLQRQPRHADILSELRAVADAIENARDAIERLLDAPASAPARQAARRQISGGGRRNVLGGIQLNAASNALEAATTVMEEAVARVPSIPARHKTASSLPIEWIFDAVQLGRIIAGREPLRDTFLPSTSPTSPFRRFIGICYEAVDASTADPERAMKAYLKRWRAVEKAIARNEQLHDETERPPKT